MNIAVDMWATAVTLPNCVHSWASVERQTNTAAIPENVDWKKAMGDGALYVFSIIARIY